MLLAILRVCSEKELESIREDEDDDTRTILDVSMSSDLAAGTQLIKNKILAVGRMQKVFRILWSVLIVFLLPCLLIPRCREESENASEFASDRQTSQGSGQGVAAAAATTTATTVPPARSLQLYARICTDIRIRIHGCTDQEI